MLSDANYLLVVDDNKAICKILSDFLLDEGYAVKTTFSGDQAIRAIRAQIPRAILIDYNMPGKNGLETLKEVQGLLSGVPVIMITANADKDVCAEAQRKGLVSYLVSKPFNISSLVHLITQPAPSLPYAQAN
jgi:DNA-binding NtrC family response regulator